MGLCDSCQRKEAKIVITDEGHNHLCFDCHNKLMAEVLDMDLEPQPKAFNVTDSRGVRRDFTVIQRLFPLGVFMEAEENIDYGYHFAVHGELDCNQSALFQQLVDKVKSGVATSHITTNVYPNGQQTESIVDDKVVGRLDYDESNEDAPMVVIDGKPYTWEQFGEMVKAYEGFQIQVKLFDMTDDLE